MITWSFSSTFSLTFATIGMKFAYPKTLSTSGTEVTYSFRSFEAINSLLIFPQWWHALSTSFFLTLAIVGVEVFPPLSHYAVITSVFHKADRHCSFKLLFLCVLLQVIISFLYGATIDNMIKVYQDRVREVPLILITSFRPDYLGYAGDANKLFLTFLFSDRNFGLQLL